MDKSDMLKMFEQRKRKMLALYHENVRTNKNLSKQHQIFGAISELDLMLEVLKFSIKKEAPINNHLSFRKQMPLKERVKESIMKFMDDTF
ncbi:hypothetical protein COT47_03910 [Candidatus Woesearchaeota archaeon CG08_land_8_20_14_0_20_43_7]|nr:MAG: hypothetical protein COT47_03910 [Candidatus Woesearchaeota archaeon CG08_land_8_20_14_0_20_43_7]